MVEYLQAHKNYIKKLLLVDKKEVDWKAVQAVHERKITYLQHERLIHLLVTLTFGLASLLAFCFATLLARVELHLVGIVLIIVDLFYIFHYYQLENGVQSLYILSNRIEEKINQ